jgi:cyclin A
MDGMGIQQCIPVDGAMDDGTGIRSLLLVRSREPYGHCIDSQIKRRPTSDFMESLQHDINKNMRGILIDWLVEVAEEYKLVPDTLYYTVSYIDRFLSSAAVPRQRLQLLGVSCMLIVAYVSSELYLQVLEIMCMSGFLAIG